MPVQQIVVPMLAADVKVFSLWGGSSNSVPIPSFWNQPWFDDSAWAQATARTPDPTGGILTHGEDALWSANTGTGTNEIVLFRWHFTVPTNLTDGNGLSIPQGSTTQEILPATVGPPLGSVQTEFEGHSPLTSAQFVAAQYNALSSVAFPNITGAQLFQGASNLLAILVNPGGVSPSNWPYGPWSPGTYASLAWTSRALVFFQQRPSGRSYAQVVG